MTVQAQLQHAVPGLEVLARSENKPEVELRPVSGDVYDGALALLSPGSHRLTVRAVQAGSTVEGPLSASLQLQPFAVGTLDVALADGPGAQLALSADRIALAVGETANLQLQPPDGTAVELALLPPGCGVVSRLDAGRVRISARSPGPCRVTAHRLTAAIEAELTLRVRPAASPLAFPLRVAAGGRFLEDQRGMPVFLKGETAWLALVNLTDAEQEAYLADRAAKGFNAVEVMLVNHDYTEPPNPVPPANRAGETPFQPPDDFAHPGAAYFQRAVAFVDRAAAHGMAVLLAPNYLGFDGGKEGWWKPLTSSTNTRAVCFQLGRYLGERFRDRPNVLWLAGGDFLPPPGVGGRGPPLGDPPRDPVGGGTAALDRALERLAPGRTLHRRAALRRGDGPQWGVPVRRGLDRHRSGLTT